MTIIKKVIAPVVENAEVLNSKTWRLVIFNKMSRSQQPK